MSGERSSNPVGQFLEELRNLKVADERVTPIVIHLFFELGFRTVGLPECIDDNVPLALFCEYEKAAKRPISNLKPNSQLKFTPLQSPKRDIYNGKFKKIYDHLLNGDCYQVNLTETFVFRAQEKLSPRKLIASLWSDPMKIGAYSHATYIHSLNKLFFSNSPECLFQYNPGEVSSMPIKGTIKVASDQERLKAWKKLVKSEKDQGELYMITDLIRSDLAKLSGRPAKIKQKKIALHVPNLVHQFSRVVTEVDSDIDLYQIVNSLFPGGSISGAPKKKVMKIIKTVEDNRRGFYCGSTILLYKKVKTASINIRSVEVDYDADEIIYGSGGGITLKSDALDEFDELMAKLTSFLDVLRT